MNQVPFMRWMGMLNPCSIDSIKKRDKNVPIVSEMEDTGLQYGVNIGAKFYASRLNQYVNIKWNN